MAAEAVATTAAAVRLRTASPAAVVEAPGSANAGSTRSGPTGGVGSARRPQEPLFYSPITPPCPTPPGAYDSDAVIPDLCHAAYILECGPNMAFTRTPLDIDAASSSASAGAGGSASLRVDALRRAWRCDQDASSSSSSSSVAGAGAAKTSASQALESSHRLFVLRDTCNEDTNHIICSALDVDPAFLAAHTTGQRYRARDRPWRGQSQGVTFAASSYTYPQVLTLLVAKARVESPITMGKEVQVDGPDGLPPEPDNASTGAAPVPTGYTVLASSSPPMSNGAVQSTGHELGQRGSQEKIPEATTASATAVKPKSLGSSPESSPFSWPPAAKDDVSHSPVAMFCRASLWTSPRANVLLLDRSPSSTTLEDTLVDALDDMAMSGYAVDLGNSCPEFTTTADVFDKVIVGLAYDQWMDFFDTLGSSSRQASNGAANKKLYWDMAQFLEQNLTAARVQAKKIHHKQQQWQSQQSHDATRPQPGNFQLYDEPNFINSDDWRALLSRLERTVALLPLQKRKSLAKGKISRYSTPGATFTVNRADAGDIEGLTTRSPAAAGYSPAVSASPSPTTDRLISNPPPFSSTPEGKDALSRVTYMGGILLPFSIIAGVLSMSDPFGPGDSLFWVFWVIALPLTCLTLVIIYADDIRKAYVWQPMSHESLQEAIKKGEAIPAVAAAALANAAEAVIDKFSSELDSEIETEPVTAAVRPSNTSGSDRRRARVRVTTDSGPGGPTYYRLAEPPDQAAEGPPATVVFGIRPPPPNSAAVDAAGAANAVIAEGNDRVAAAMMSARRRRRFTIPNPLRLFTHPKPRQNAPRPVFPDVEPALPYDETVVIDMNRPNTNSGVAEVVGRPVAGPNIGAPGCPAIIMQQRPDGSQPTAWRQQQLGWGGAIKSIVGYHKPQSA